MNDYEDIIAIKNEKVTNTISHNINNSVSVFLNLINVIVNSILSLGIIVSLIYLNTNELFYYLGFISFIYLIIIFLIKRKLTKNSVLISQENSNIIAKIRDTLFSIKNVIIDDNFETYLNTFRNSVRKVRNSIGKNSFLSTSPRFFVEAIFIIFFIIWFLISYNDEKLDYSNIAQFSSIIFGIQKILPMINQIFVNFTNSIGKSGSLNDVSTSLLLQKKKFKFSGKKNLEKLEFNNYISISNLNFKYKNDEKFLFKDLNVKFLKGKKIAIIGKSGVGKSTFFDLLMGLLKPCSGSIKVDNVDLNRSTINSYFKLISHVPQSTLILNLGTRQNISFNENINNLNNEKINLLSENFH